VRPVGTFYSQLAEQTLLYRSCKGSRGWSQPSWIFPEGEQRLAAALHVEDQLAADQDDQGTRFPSGSMPFSVRPWKRGTVGVGWITSSENNCGGLCRLALMCAQSINRTSECELGSAQTFDEVAAPTLAGLLECAECPVGGAEPTLGLLGENAATRYHAIAVQLGEDVRCQSSGGRCR
jgi:hypothetical protein